MLFLTEPDIQKVLNWPDVINCLAAAYQSMDALVPTPPRVVARRNGATLRILTAMAPSGLYMGVKVIARGRKSRWTYLIPLWEQETAELVCLLDARQITAFRTAGTSALAADRVLPEGDISIAVLGAGLEAHAHVSAIAAVRRCKALSVFSPTPVSRQTFAEKYSQELRIDCRALDSASAAVNGADVVIAAARSRDESPVLEGAWLRPGTMVISIGSTLPEQREVDVETIRRADTIIADVPEEVMHDTGDMMEARKAGVNFESKVVPLAALVQGQSGVQQTASNIVLYKSVGAAVQDLAVAQMCFEKARQHGLGMPLPVGLVVKGK